MGAEKRTGGQLLVSCLKNLGVETSFGVPGESYLAVLDALYDVDIQFVLCRQEGAAGFASAAWGKLTGQPGICFVTRGPGATNASIGVHTAMQDSSPMLLFVGQIGVGHKEREAFQEVDYKAFFGSMAKWATEIDDADRIPEIVGRAWRIALSGRPGPVVIALPEDMLTTLTSVQPCKKIAVAEAGVDTRSLTDVATILSAAERPLVLAGGGGWTKQGKADVQVLKERLPNCQITYIEYPSITTEVLKRAIKQKGRKTRTLDELTHLSIGGVKLIPWELSRLRSLTGLLLTDGELQNVVGLGTLPSLEVLSLTRNKISDLTGLENCEELKHLMLVENGLTTLPQGIEKLVQIEDLNLTSNELKNIAPLSKLVNLKTLHLGGNPIDDFTGLSPLSEIQVLNLANTGLIELPSSISSLVKLENLMISDNRIKQLDQLSGLKNLKRLSIQNNDLSTIPLGLRELTSLEILDLRKNKLNKRQINELQKHLPTCRIKHDLE